MVFYKTYLQFSKFIYIIQIILELNFHYSPDATTVAINQLLLAVHTLTVSESGAFPNKQGPRVVWIGLQSGSDNSLITLHRWIESKLVPLGFVPEKRRFSPHLTVGRIKAPGYYNEMFNYMEKIPFSKMTFTVREINFMKSDLKPTGAVYSILKKYPLG